MRVRVNVEKFCFKINEDEKGSGTGEHAGGLLPFPPSPPHPTAGLPAPIPCTYFLKHFFS